MKMKLLTMRLVLALLFCTCYSFLVAQTDSSWLDLGRIKLKKEFTQTVTIKGKDLEQMPFANLAEAINVWLYGLATNNMSVAYVIDGNMITDVNAYSIHDIEEITLVQNALVQLNGANKEKQLVLITTRKHREKSKGLHVAGSSFLVTNSFQNAAGDKQKSETNFYHQYYISAYKNHSKIQYGLSASYLRDVYPYPRNSYDIEQPYHIDRFRFNGYLNAAIDANNSVWLRAGYVPAKLGAAFNNVAFGPAKIKSTTNYFTVEAGWQSRLSRRFTNELSAGISPVLNKGSVTSMTAFPGPTGYILRQDYSTSKTRWNSLLINDHLTYHAAVGNWQIEPAVDFTYRYVKSKYTANSIVTELPNSIITQNATTSQYKYNVFLLTPAVNVVYKNIFNAQAGFVYNLSKAQQSYSAEAEKLLPFVTMTVDVLKAFKPESKISWKVYGSYAGAGNYADGSYQLNEATAGFVKYPYPNNYSTYNPNSLPLYGGDSSNYMVHAGTSMNFWGDRLQVSYGFEKRKYRYAYVSSLPGSPIGTLVRADVYNTIHRLGITAKVWEGTMMNWLTALNVSAIKPKLETDVEFGGPVVPVSLSRNETLWTGGWVNRFSYKKWMAGLDLLYVLNQNDYSGYNFGKDNAVAIRNIYAGYQLLLKQRPLDVFIECRNPGQKNENNIPDRRNYFGAGFKATL